MFGGATIEHAIICTGATGQNLTKTLVKNENPKFSYRNNENDNFHHSRSSNKHVELVYTKYEVNRSIIEGGGCIQPCRAQNRVFDTLTTGFPKVPQGGTKVKKSDFRQI